MKSVRNQINHGVIPAVPIPFNKDGTIDYKSQENYIKWMNTQAISCVALWAHTGRGLYLTSKQREEVFNAWRKGLDDDKLILCGVGAQNREDVNQETYLKDVMDMARQAKKLGADIIMPYAPTYYRNKPQQDERIVMYHREIAKIGLPMVIFYLYEAAGGINYSQRVLRELFSIENVMGIKMATLDSVMTFQDVSNMIQDQDFKVSLITGEDRMFGYTVIRGATSALVGMGSVYTKLQYNMMQAYYKEEYKQFIDLLLKVDQLAECTFINPMEGYIERLLYILSKFNIIKKESAYDPYGPGVSEKEKRTIDKVIEDLGEM